MSQGDYIQRKKIIHTLAKQSDFSQVIDAQPFSEFKQYSISKNILNTKPTFNLLTPSNNQIIFEMHVKKMTNCPGFIVCSGTNARAYRTRSRGFVMNTGLPVMSNIASGIESDNTIGKCALNKSCTDDNIACCKINHLRM